MNSSHMRDFVSLTWCDLLHFPGCVRQNTSFFGTLQFDTWQHFSQLFQDLHLTTDWFLLPYIRVPAEHHEVQQNPLHNSHFQTSALWELSDLVRCCFELKINSICIDSIMQCFTNPFPQGPVKVALSKVRIKVRLMQKLLVYQCIFVNVRHVVFFKCC